MDLSIIRNMFVQHALPHLVFDDGMAQRCAAMVEAIKFFMGRSVVSFIKLCSGTPLLWSYRGDGAPVLLQNALSGNMPSGKVVRRNAGQGTEMFVERSYLKYINGTGDHKLLQLMRDPRRLSSDKTS